MGSGSHLVTMEKVIFGNTQAAARASSVALGVLLCLGTGAQASQTIYVDGPAGNDSWTGLCRSYVSGSCGPKKTIQGGINIALNGDTVIVADGTYSGVGNQQIKYGGRLITVQSETGPDSCVLDGGGADINIFTFNSNETAEAVLDGFTITHTELC